ncbi:hypothetical protein DFH07DRAFT_943745 [Mycena maculata]|uniref:Uncharacterized protein n=1 Tax=Mycena maculata TaxID=230809 RepID=A0AAD7IEH0_9AGAR|nr:hypothetical protein DFH07DRAFT_943745 [Mycena maculata]
MPVEKLSAAGLSLSDSHPLSEELTSLRAAVTRFQNEAHASSIKLQRHALDTSSFSERIAQLEAENALFTTELTVLRANPAPAPSSGSGEDTVAELTLSLRRLNAKLSLTEAALDEHTRALAQATTLARQHTHAAGEAYALAARARGREEEGHQRERALERAVAQAREETKLSDRVVGEYAALVRRLEGRELPVSASAKSDAGGSSATLVDPPSSPLDALAQGKAQVAALADTFADENAALEARVAALQGELDVSNAQLAAARTLTAELGDELARAKFAAEQARVDDRSAAGMVERYMKFTQQTTTSLHASLAALRARHAATTATLEINVASLTQQLGAARRGEERLRAALDEAGGALVRETVGRRREVRERVRLVGREEGVVGALRGAVGRVEGASAREGVPEGGEAEEQEKARAAKMLERLLGDVRRVLAVLDGEGADAGAGAAREGRMMLLESAVEMLVGELEGEVARRVEVERRVGLGVDGEGEREAGEGGDGKAGDAGAGADGQAVDATPVAVHATSSPHDAHVNGKPNGVLPAEEENDVPPPPASSAATDSPDAPAPAIDALPRPSESANLDAPAVIEIDAEIELHQPSPRLPAESWLLAEDYGVLLDGGMGGSRVGEEEEEGGGGLGSGEGDGEKEIEGGEAGEQEQEVNPREEEEHVAPPPPPESIREGAVAFPSSKSTSTPAAVAFPSTTSSVPKASSVPSSPPVSNAPVPPPPSDAIPFPLPAADAPLLPTASDTQAHPLLADLAARYDALQRAFRACHLALQDLRAALAEAQDTHGLRGAVERLHDYTEDARVELEIRVADARVLARGWETIVSTSGVRGDDKDGDEDGGGGGGAAAVERQIAAFMQRDEEARAAFARKLEDVEHDIGAVKRVVYAPPSEALPPPVSPVASPDEKEKEGAGGWAAWLRSATPSPSYTDAPTFGSLMTSPRLRHSSSAARLGRKQQRNPLEGLGLRVAMPVYVQEEAPRQQQQRQRTISGVYMLGLGMHAHGSGGRRPSGLGLPPRVDGGGGGAEGADVDVDADVE